MDKKYTNIKERCLYFAKNQGIGIENFLDSIGMTYGSFKGKAKLGSLNSDAIERIYTKYPEINGVWLLTGKGPMINSENNFVSETNEEYSTKTKSSGVPYYDLDFTASFIEVTNTQQIQPDHYVSHPFFSGCDFIVRASGQSMAKLIKHGDAIGLVKVQDWQDFIPMGEIYAIVTKNGFRMIKIITKGPDDNHFLLISKPSDSKKDEFPPQKLAKKTILSVFKVQASSHLF